MSTNKKGRVLADLTKKQEAAVTETAVASAEILSMLATPATKSKSRVAGLRVLVIDALKKSAMSVSQMASDFQVPERDIRLAIDSARLKQEPIKRLSKGVFGYASYASEEAKAA